MPQGLDELYEGTLNLAVNALNTSSTEYQRRLFCSRAYYTLYHKTINYLDVKHNYKQVVTTNAYRNMGSHNQLTTFLDDHIHIPKTNTHREYKSLVYRLKAMKQLRVKADYHLESLVDENDCILAENQFHKTIEIIDNLTKN